MISNYLKIAFRNLLGHKLFSILNILGLSAGIASAVVILLWVNDELSYDSKFKNADRIYRITEKQNISNVFQHLATTSGPVAQTLKNEIPDVEEAARVLLKKKILLTFKDKSFYEDKTLYVDPSFFKIFDFEHFEGDPENALKTPNSIVLTEHLSKKYFGNTNPMGKTIRLNNKTDLLITGIISNPPKSHLKFTSLISISSLNSPGWINNYWVRSLYTYVLLKPNSSIHKFSVKLPSIVEKYYGKDYKYVIAFKSQPIKTIHLNSDLVSEIEANGNLTSVYIFISVAIAILLLACFNYINLSTAQFINKIREVGLRKTLGASKSQLILQFLFEAFLLVCISFLIAFISVLFLLPYVNTFLLKDLKLLSGENVKIFLLLSILILLITLLSGLVPSVKFSQYKTVEAVGNKLKRQGNGLRKYLTVSQFSISISLVIICVIVFQQFEYIQNKKLGFEKDKLIYLKGIEFTKYKGNLEIVKDAFMKIPQVTYATCSYDEIGEELDVSEVRLESSTSDHHLIFSIASADPDYFKTLKIPLISGRNFIPANSSDTSDAFIINETAVKRLGFKSPQDVIGKKLILLADGSVQRIIGVVKDFHVSSLHKQIEPVLFFYSPYYSNKIYLKLNNTSITKTIKALEDVWKSLVPGHPFEFSFVDERLNNLYQKDQELRKILTSFSILAIFIACLGLFGMATFTIEYKTKEVGIRKVLGASVENLIVFLSKDFLKLVLVSATVATPISWYLADHWLLTFAYRININWLVFPIVGVLTMILALAICSFLITNVAMINPARTLKE